jgi:tRNA-specific 2-thiouridylase
MTLPKMKVVVGLSGGVDSAIAAARLKAQGCEVTGLFMKNWEEDDDAEYCAAREDLAMAERVVEALDIPLKTVNFAHEYWDRVFAIFLREYEAGRTPNPDVLCNREIKFKEFLSYAQHLGSDFIATGHYARVKKENGLCRLLKAVDHSKDQSYFLHTLDQKALSPTLFPLGEARKTDIRAEASALGLPNAFRKDSTGICFIGERRFSDFLSRYLPNKPGEMRTPEGKPVGEHQGLWFYTLGQRHGLDIGGPGEAWYVCAKNVETNVLTVVQGHNHPDLMRQSAMVEGMHWVGNIPEALPLRCCAKTRYRQEDQNCLVHEREGNTLPVEFEAPQRAPTPGQSLVLYQGDEVLGGGIIGTTHPVSSPES